MRHNQQPWLSVFVVIFYIAPITYRKREQPHYRQVIFLPKSPFTHD
jgi:hypothetical protein